MSKILELREQRAKAWETAKVFLDSRRGSDGLISAEDENTYNKMEADVVNLGKEIDRLERQKALDLELSKPINTAIKNTPVAPDEIKTFRASKEYKEAFWKSMRSKSSYEIQNVLQTTTDAEGGFLVPSEFESTLIQALEDENIIRPLANIITTSSGERKIPVVAAHGSASWVEESAVIPESGETFSIVNLGAHKLASMVKISDELVNDAAFNLENYIASEFARRIGRAEEKAFLDGDGSNKPTGIFTSAEVGITSASAAAITVDEIIDLYHSLREPYRKSATFITNDLTIKAIRKLKDSAGNYIWSPSIVTGQPDTILNRPIKTSNYVPTIATGAKVIAFGDIRYYWIAQRQGISFQRLNELYAPQGQIGFKISQRIDGKLTLSEAIKVLKMKE